MQVEIIDRGRGPEIKGTRITVYTIWDYPKYGRDHTYIAGVLGLSTQRRRRRPTIRPPKPLASIYPSGFARP